MALYKIQGNLVKKIRPSEVDLERNLQSLFEHNLEELLNIRFLAHEYPTTFGGRIDSLGIDKNGAPCIIEYKKNQNDNIINQGLSYLRWLLDHKADYEKLVEGQLVGIYNSPLVTYNGDIKGRAAIDWDSPRVICIAENFNRFDLDTADILPISVELYRYRLYEGDLLMLEADRYQKGESASPTARKVSKQKNEPIQKTYTIEDHILRANDVTKQLFYALREKILSIDEAIKEEPKKKYIAYKTSTNFVDVVVFIGKFHGLKIFLNIKSGQLKDPVGIARDLTKPKPVGHWGNGDYEIKVDHLEQIDPVFELIKQSYNLNK